ncbi:MAG: HD domain-containing protein [Lacipirellulaceae bacterium]
MDARPSGSRLRPVVTDVKRQLAERREEVRAAHNRGVPAVQVCAKQTASVDAAIHALWNAALDDLPTAEGAALRERCVLVAHGGYGRRQLTAGSDVDLMVLYDPAVRSSAEGLAQRLTRDVFDIGLEFGHSLRTPEETLTLAKTDPVVATSLVESRPLIGSQSLFESYFPAYSSAMRKRPRAAARAFVAARRAEREKYGETVYLLEPNVKRSRGALRDVHLLRWLWFLQAGISDLDRLHAQGVISKFDHHRLVSSRDFLLQVRNELHFGSTAPRGPSGATDALHRTEQVRIAEKLGYRGAAGLLPVEQFMRDYFRHAGHVWFLASRVAELATARRPVAAVFDPVLGRSIDNDYTVGYSEVSATSAGNEKLRRRLDEALRLLDIARVHDRRIAQETWYTVYRAAPGYGPKLAPEAAQRFLEIVANPTRLGLLLRRAHDLGVLERVVPAFADARCLLQFNQYHKFTVDEHSLRAVALATEFATRPDQLGDAYRRLKSKRVLHLALLLHDLGKGKDGDHSVIGEQIALATGDRLGLPEAERDRIALLVRRHLDMSVLAFRRDTSKTEVLDQFAALVGTAENLRALFVLTCADMAAVGPDVLNDWKVSVLGELFQRTLDRIEGQVHPLTDRRNAIRVAVWKTLTPRERDDSLLKRLFTSLPEGFVASRSPLAIVGALRRLSRISATAPPPPIDGTAVATVADAWGGYLGDGSTLELVAAVSRGVGRGVFASMAGVLSSKGLRILSAETSVLDDELLLLRFAAEDPQSKSQPNAAEANRRVASLTAAMVHSIGSTERPTFPRVWGADRQSAAAALSSQPNEVRIDTALAEDCAIVEVFTFDRVGLLYELARTLHELGLVIRFAKIATSLDQVVDVFYVAERAGAKPTAPQRLTEISRRLMNVIEP